ncbi:fimbrial protein, partial [Pseudomonas carnis]|uniref:fimbrial protein n=1 Tax=Pseudomonas carnis TaxID=2487355 RepID=UPI001F1D93DB
LLFTSNSTLAELRPSSISTQNVYIQKPALNGSIIAEALTGWIDSGRQTVVTGVTGGYRSFGLTITSSPSTVSYSEAGNSYTVYHVVLPDGRTSGIGFVLRTHARDCQLGGSICANTGPYIQDTGNDYKTFRGGGIWAYDIYYSYQVKFIATSQNIETGSYSLGGSAVGYGSFGVFLSPASDYASVGLNTFELTYQQSGCTASLSPAVINMGVVSPLRFNGFGTTVASNTPVTVSLECTTPDIGVLVTMTDQNNPSNSTDTLQLTSGTTATASGVGVQFLRDGVVPVIYGPASSFVELGSNAQWRVKDKSMRSKTAAFVLTPQYIQTANTITPGEANAVASITFAYD